MSIKTTLKRIALVAVSALGLGLFSTVSPANAAGATAGITVAKSSITVVGSQVDSTTAFGAIFKITLNNIGTATAHTLAAGETLTATVVGVPAGTTATAKTVASNAADLLLEAVAPDSDANTGNPYARTAALQSSTGAESRTVNRADWSLQGGGAAEWGASSTSYASSTSSSAVNNAVYLRVVPARGADGGEYKALDQGEYSIRLRLTASNSTILVEDETIKVKFVSTAVSAGASITAADAGSFAIGSAFDTQSSTKYLRATLTDANGGLVIENTSSGNARTPDIVADFINATTLAAIGSGTITANDGGTYRDSGYSTTDSTNVSNRGNGVYGITFTSTSLDTATANSTTANLLRVRYGNASDTEAISVLTALAGAAGTPSLVATGIPATDVAPNWSLPLTTTSATLKVGNATAGNGYVATVTWTSAASGSVSPQSGIATVVYADAAGYVNVPLTNSAPVSGATATINIAGFATAPADQVITWRKSIANSVTVDINGAYVKTGSTTTATATVLDHFGGPVAGVQLLPSFESGSEYYSATRTYSALTTDASGQVSYTWTDATAAADDYDQIIFTEIGTSVSGSGTITYAAAAPAPTALTLYYNANPTVDANYNNVVTAVPTTGIYVDGVSSKFAVQKARNLSKPITVANSQDALTLRADGNAEGAKIVATASSGAYILNASNLAVSTRTSYADETGDVYFDVLCTQSGANTITFTSGTVSSAASFWCDSANTNTRFVTLTGPATGAANGDLLSYTVTVTDRFGNAMNSKTVSVTASGVAVLGGGSTVTSYTTDATGTFSFTGTSLNAAGGAGTFKVSVSGTDDMFSLAGYAGSDLIDSTVAAGNNSASLSVTFAAGTNAAQAAAEAATDAASEAIDAANAATDAANLAAEAADAATVAAEEARDAADAATAAVEELATQVATLMAALKAQITTLANTVAKIAKKVKA